MTERPPQPRPTITVWQPYASLIMHGIKTFETRPSEPGGDARPPGSDRYPGLDLNPGDALWIHAAYRDADDLRTLADRLDPPPETT